MASNDICMTGVITDDNFVVYDRYHNNMNTPAQLVRKSPGDIADALLIKYGPDGRFKWSAQMSGTYVDVGYSNAMDAQGNVYTAGYFSDVSLNVYQGSSGAQSSSVLAATLMPNDMSYNNAYLLRYKNNGTYDWGVTAGPNIYTDNGRKHLIHTALSSSNHVYLTAAFSGPTTYLYNDSDMSICYINQYDSSMNINVLLAKYDADSTLHWVARVDGPTDNLLRNSVTVDALDNTYLTMLYRDVSGQSMYVYNGMPSPGEKGQMDADASLNLFVQGSEVPFEPHTEGVIVKYNYAGLYQWALQIGIQQQWGSIKMTTALDGSIYVTGNLDSNFPAGNIQFYDAKTSGSVNGPVITITNVQNLLDRYNMFVAKYSADGLCQWVNIMSGVNADEENGGPFIGSYGIAVDSHGNCFTTGYFEDKFVVYDRYMRNYNGVAKNTPLATLMSHRAPDLGTWNGVNHNGYVISFDANGLFRWVVQMYNDNVRGYDVAVDVNNQVVVSGYFGYWRQSLYITDPLPFQYPLNSQPLNVNSYTMRHVGANGSDNYNYFIVKLTNKGKLVWGVQMGVTKLDNDLNTNYTTNSIATNNVSPKRDV